MNGLVDLKELSQRESERVEWKENVADIEDIIKTAVAFSNDYSNLGGGYIVCGARETKDEYLYLLFRLQKIHIAIDLPGRTVRPTMFGLDGKLEKQEMIFYVNC